MNELDNNPVTTPTKGMVALLSLLLFVLAFSFQGTRGIWEPDEGYYIGIARDMVETGDWVVPQMNLRPWLDKPPVVYWGSGLSMKLFGFNEWAARLPHAIWFALTTLFVGLLGRAFWDSRTGFLASLIYATSPIPFVAANVVTPDTPLAFWITAGLYCFWQATRVQTTSRRLLWNALFGIALGFAVLSKGPATFVFMAPLFVFLLATKTVKHFCLHVSFLLSLFLFAAIGASWYFAVIHYIPGASAYFFDSQIFGRLVSDRYDRNSEWYAFLYVYLPVILFGTLPWSVAWYPEAKKRRSLAWDRLRTLNRDADRRVVFLFLVTVVPLIVFSCARSRLPLYVLPLFTPLSIIGARCWMSWKPRLFSVRETTFPLFPVGLWCLSLLAVKAGMAYWPAERDTRAFWNAVREFVPMGRFELVVVNGRRHGLCFYSSGDVEWVTTRENPYPSFYAQESLEEELHELPTSSHSHVLITRDRDFDTVAKLIADRGHSFRSHEGPFDSRILVCPPAPAEDRAVRIAAMGDTRSGDSGQIQLGSALCHIDENRPLDGIILLGDNLSFYGEPEHITDHFEKPYAPLLQNGVQFFAVLGNHDVTKGFEEFQLNYPYFNMNGRRYHTRVFGDNLVQCVFLDSTTVLIDPRQQSWLRKTLRDSTSIWKLVAMHHPLYGRTKRRPEPEWEYRDLLEPILLDGKADIVLNGHNHLYMRIKPQNGIHHFTAGSGGELESGVLLENDPDLVVGYDRTTVALVLQFTEEKCEFQAVNVLEEVVDQGVIVRDCSEPYRLDEQTAGGG